MASARDTLEVRSGHVTVSFDTTFVHSGILALIGEVPDASVIRYNRGNWYDLRFPEQDDPAEYVAAFRALEGVRDAVPAFVVRCDATPNDAHFDDQWALENTGQSGGTTDADIDAPAAWGTETGDTTSVIAVIDTGADLDHDDLAASLWVDWNDESGWGRLNVRTMLDGVEFAPHSHFTYQDSSSCKVFCPGGDADSFVIDVTVKDGSDSPVPGVLAHAIWAAFSQAAFKLCCLEDGPDCTISHARTYADGPTDSLGDTTITLRRAGGAATLTPILVRVYGLGVTARGILRLIDFLSYDIDGDCVVDGDDFTTFNGWMGGPKYYWRGDFDCDQDVDRADSLLLAAHADDACPGRGGRRGDADLARAADSFVRSYPNPFGPAATISYAVPAGGADVSVFVYDVSGRLVRVLVNGPQPEGLHSPEWDGRDTDGVRVASGVYFCRTRVGEVTESRKMLLLE